MPGWYEATNKLNQDGRIKIVGIIEEQHPDRARLFMQWKQMDWPIMIDALNLYRVKAIPITIFIDENGFIRKVSPRLRNASQELQDFLSLEPMSQPDNREPAAVQTSNTAQQAIDLFLWKQPDQLTEVINLFSNALQDKPDPAAYFRLGVAYRSRFDSNHRINSDFKNAIENWQKALDLDPNQYIWRRRIQQYGPRLDKPYPFYDWIIQARKDIEERGEHPIELRIEPGGAEFAQPLRKVESKPETVKEPDPAGKILRDDQKFIQIETVVVKSTSDRKKSARIHISFIPNQGEKAHWNNEAENLKLWIKLPADWQTGSRLIEIPNPATAVSDETRKIEFEVTWPDEILKTATEISAYALYYVCEDIDGTCLYRRQDISIPIRLD